MFTALLSADAKSDIFDRVYEVAKVTKTISERDSTKIEIRAVKFLPHAGHQGYAYPNASPVAFGEVLLEYQVHTNEDSFPVLIEENSVLVPVSFKDDCGFCTIGDEYLSKHTWMVEHLVHTFLVKNKLMKITT